jgi:hypothetical protein
MNWAEILILSLYCGLGSNLFLLFISLLGQILGLAHFFTLHFSLGRQHSLSNSFIVSIG